MSQLPRYESYKESGVQWLGEIPSHWKLIKNKFILSFSKGLTITKENLVDEGIPCVNYGEVHSKFGFEVDSNRHGLKCVSVSYLESDPNALLKKGDFIFADTSEDVKGSGNFTYINSDVPTFAGYHTITAKITIINNPRFLAYTFESDAHRNQVRTLIKGVKVYSITQLILKNTIVWLPPLSEQNFIVDFLDKRLAQVDVFIAKQETLLEKLAEQRIALISHAVTKGLNPDVEMKDSGVEWLGVIPSHWMVKKLKFLKSYFKGFAFKSEDFNDIGIPLIKASNIKKYNIVNVDSYIAFDKVQDTFDKVKLLEGDLILSTVGSLPNVLNSAVGQIAYINSDYNNSYLNQNNICFRSNGQVSSAFLKYFVMSSFFRRNLDIKALWIANQAYLEVLDVQGITIIFPSLNEQKIIIDYLDIETKNIDNLMQTVSQTIEKLKEYRSTLITQVVTGKIDVRGA